MMPEHIRAFLRASIKSVWALDLLVLMKSQPDQAWTAASLNDQLRASISLVEEILDSFRRSGLIAAAEGGAVRYAPATALLEQNATELVQIYAARPMAVIKEILSAPNEKIHSFVDAFLLKQDEP